MIMPYKYTDLEKKEWDLKITLGTARRIEASDYGEVTKIQFAFLQPDQELFAEVFSNVQFAMALAWTIIQPQIHNNYSLSPEKLQDPAIASEAEMRFVDAMDGDVLQAAKQALMESLADFFPDQRTVLLTLQNKMKKARKLIEMELENVDGVLDEMMMNEIKRGTSAALGKMRGEDSTKPADNSNIIPEISNLSHSGNSS